MTVAVSVTFPETRLSPSSTGREGACDAAPRFVEEEQRSVSSTESTDRGAGGLELSSSV